MKITVDGLVKGRRNLQYVNVEGTEDVNFLCQ